MSNRLRIALLSTIATAAFTASPALSQVAAPAETQAAETTADEQTTPPVDDSTTPADAGEIVVTGSRIARPDLEVASPVTVIGQDEIQLRQPNTAEEVLRDLPSVRPALGPGVNNGGDGSATVDLRGLNAAGSNTSQRTLVLVDSRRVVPFGLSGFTDLNNIPVALIDRVDVVTGGASTVYGADAVAGVVNFILQRNFSGAELSAGYRVSERGDATQYRADLTVGANFEDGRGNAVLSIGYQKRNPLLTTDRDIALVAISSVNGLFQGSQSSVPAFITSPGNAALGIPASDLGGVIDPKTGLFRTALQSDTFNSNIGTFFQTKLERYNVYASARYEITPGIEVYTSGMFTRNNSRIQIAASPFTSALRLPLNNPFLPVGARNQLCAATDSNPGLAGLQPITPANCAAAAAVQGGPGTPGYIEVPVVVQRRLSEYGPRGNNFDVTMFQVQAGLRGEIVDGLNYDLSAQFGESSQNQLRENWGSFSRIQQGIRSFRNSGGQAVCSDTANGCVPVNFFGPEGSITPEMIAFFDLDAQIRRVTQQTVVTGSVSGDLFNIQSPFANSPIGFAIGTEYRKISSEALPDAASQISFEVVGTGARTPPDIGQYDVKEAFGEIFIPLVEESFIHGASIEAGIRYSDYSTTGTSTTWKAGGTIEPVEGFKFRGMYQRAVRSPNIQELFQGQVIGLTNLTVDPCGGAAPPASQALCLATGAPAGSYGSIPQPSSGQINTTSSGNPNLDVEKARTYTLGAVFTPSFVPRLSITVDYFNIVVKDAISNPSASDILNGCYSASLNPTQTSNAFCQLIFRSPLNGSLNGSSETPGVLLAGSNLGQIETAGVDLGINYRLDLEDFGAPGDLKLGFNGTWLDYYHFQATPNAINRDCTGYYSTSCTNPRPEYKWNARAVYSLGEFDIALMWNHISSVRIEPFNAAAITPLRTPQAGGPNPTTVLDAFERIDAYDYFDLSLRYGASEHLQLTLTVENLFDKDPPLVGAGVGGATFNNGNTFPTTYDPIGRAFTMGARLKF